MKAAETTPTAPLPRLDDTLAAMIDDLTVAFLAVEGISIRVGPYCGDDIDTVAGFLNRVRDRLKDLNNQSAETLIAMITGPR